MYKTILIFASVFAVCWASAIQSTFIDSILIFNKKLFMIQFFYNFKIGKVVFHSNKPYLDNTLLKSSLDDLLSIRLVLSTDRNSKNNNKFKFKY